MSFSNNNSPLRRGWSLTASTNCFKLTTAICIYNCLCMVLSHSVENPSLSSVFCFLVFILWWRRFLLAALFTRLLFPRINLYRMLIRQKLTASPTVTRYVILSWISSDLWIITLQCFKLFSISIFIWAIFWRRSFFVCFAFNIIASQWACWSIRYLATLLLMPKWCTRHGSLFLRCAFLLVYCYARILLSAGTYLMSVI